MERRIKPLLNKLLRFLGTLDSMPIMPFSHVGKTHFHYVICVCKSFMHLLIGENQPKGQYIHGSCRDLFMLHKP